MLNNFSEYFFKNFLLFKPQLFKTSEKSLFNVSILVSCIIFQKLLKLHRTSHFPKSLKYDYFIQCQLMIHIANIVAHSRYIFISYLKLKTTTKFFVFVAIYLFVPQWSRIVAFTLFSLCFSLQQFIFIYFFSTPLSSWIENRVYINSIFLVCMLLLFWLLLCSFSPWQICQ